MQNKINTLEALLSETEDTKNTQSFSLHQSAGNGLLANNKVFQTTKQAKESGCAQTAD